MKPHEWVNKDGEVLVIRFSRLWRWRCFSRLWRWRCRSSLWRWRCLSSELSFVRRTVAKWEALK
jgi:hypothetical protein